MEMTEILSAFVDGEAVDAAALAGALAAPGGRETLLEFIRLRAALTDDERPSAAFVERMRRRLGGRAHGWTSRLLRIAAGIAVAALATVGAYDLVRGARGATAADEPPTPTRVIRFEPGVDWKPIEGRP